MELTDINVINAERFAMGLAPLDRLPREIDNNRRKATYWSSGGRGAAAGNWTSAPRIPTHIQTRAEADEISEG